MPPTSRRRPPPRDFTGSDGDYVVDTLPPGNYKVRFESYRLIPEFHLDRPDLASANVSRAVDGRACDRGRHPGPWQGDHGHGHRRRWRHRHRERVVLPAAAGGRLQLRRLRRHRADSVYRAHLPAGTYKVNVSAYDNRVSEWWNNATSQATGATVVLGGDRRTGIDAVLDDGATVTGTVTFPQRLSGWDDRVVIREPRPARSRPAPR